MAKIAQSRSAATRQRIIDAAVDLFSDHGFAETGINDITALAQTTTGAFYYHFGSREALVAAIMQQGWPKAWEVFSRCTQSPTPGLENIIVMTYSLSDLMKNDKTVWISNHLNQAMGQLSEEGRRGFLARATAMVDGIAGSIRPADLRDGVSPQTVGSTVWVTIHGCHLLSDAMGDDVFARLTTSWQMLLPSLVSDESLPYFQQFLARTAAQFGPQPVDEFTARRQAIAETHSEESRGTNAQQDS